MTLTPDTLAALRAAAEAATPGPWEFDPGEVGYSYNRAYFGLVADDRALGVHVFPYLDKDGSATSNATFIALANPATVLALVEEVERLRTDFTTYAQDSMCMVQKYRDRAEAAEAEVERWQGAACCAEAAADEMKRERDAAQRDFHDAMELVRQYCRERDEARAALRWITAEAISEGQSYPLPYAAAIEKARECSQSCWHPTGREV